MTTTQQLRATEYFGRQIGNRQLSGLYITDNVYGGGVALAPHSHVNAFIAICFAGRYLERIEREIYERVPRTAVFHDVQEVHSETMCRRGARVISIEFAPDWLERLTRAQVSPARSVELRNLPSILPRLIKELHHSDGASSLALEGYALQIVAELARDDEPMPRGWIVRVQRIVQARFAEPLTLQELASAAGVHPVHLARQFRKTTGRTVGQMIRELRVKRAVDELVRSRRNIADIAVRSGFADQSHMSRWLKRYTGMSASELRRRR
jgi:AraC family transcriptional regulator